ncbi:MAG TPA: hypothetical protein VLX85_06465, partial [Stellaceae bacterium]|nr:hypothetical protein [Stellaceae bacterium]
AKARSIDFPANMAAGLETFDGLLMIRCSLKSATISSAFPRRPDRKDLTNGEKFDAQGGGSIASSVTAPLCADPRRG